MKTKLIATGILGLTALSQQAHSQEKPNIVVFIADDLGWEELGAYGNPVVKTPNIDKLAQSGIKFNNYFLCASSSSPSRSCMFSGLYPHSAGAENLHDDLSPKTIIFPELLKENGYYTMLIGKSHGTNKPGVRKKFDKMVQAQWEKPWTMGDMWVQAIEERPKNQPFFMWCASIDPHRPYKQGEFTDPHDPKEVIVPPYMPDIPEMREELADYYDEISRFDEHIGMVVEKLEKEGLLNNTFIIVMTDNGRPFPQSKTRVNVQGLKSPLIICYPSLIEGGTQTNSLASAIDLAPTILDIAGIEKPGVMQGYSMMSLLNNPDSEIRKYAFGEHNWHIFMGYERVAITKDYVFIKNWLSDLPNPSVVETMFMPAYQKMYEMWKSGKLAEQYTDCFIAPRSAEELFDIKKDIHCTNNLIDNQELQSVVGKMRIVLETWQESTGDAFPGRENLKQDTSDRYTGKEFPKTTN